MHKVTDIQSPQRPLKPKITCLSRGMLNDCCRLARGSGKVYPASSYFKLSLQELDATLFLIVDDDGRNLLHYKVVVM